MLDNGDGWNVSMWSKSFDIFLWCCLSGVVDCCSWVGCFGSGGCVLRREVVSCWF